MTKSLNIQHISDVFQMYLYVFGARIVKICYWFSVFFCSEVPVCSLLVMPFTILKNDWFIMIKLQKTPQNNKTNQDLKHAEVKGRSH